MNSPKKKQTKQPPFRRVRLDGKPPSRPRGRNAVPRTEGDEAPAAAPVELTARLGYRVAEFAALCGVSPPTIWRGIKLGNIKTVDINGVTVVPVSFAVETGLLKG